MRALEKGILGSKKKKKKKSDTLLQEIIANTIIYDCVELNDDRFLSFGMHINVSNWGVFPFPDTILIFSGHPEHLI